MPRDDFCRSQSVHELFAHVWRRLEQPCNQLANGWRTMFACGAVKSQDKNIVSVEVERRNTALSVGEDNHLVVKRIHCRRPLDV